MSQNYDREILQAALVGLQIKLNEIERHIAALRGGVRTRTQSPTDKPSEPKKREMSAAGRRRIALAQKKRWAAFKALQKASTGAPAEEPESAKAAAAGD